MKRALILSVVTSGLLFAGGDIAPVEPAVVTPAPTPAPAPTATGWKFSGQGVLYYQTQDNWGAGDLFDQGPNSPTSGNSRANAGLQLRATNADLIAGIGFGAELTGLGTLGLEEDVVSGVMQKAGSELNAAYISQLYLTYGIGNTNIKIGRQELPLALSPFAWSEDWMLFKNTFNAALVVNTDLPNTTLVGAWVRDANYNNVGFNMNDFDKLNGNDGVWMLTAQNKSIADLTLTGSYYYLSDLNKDALNSTGYLGDDVNILWADAQYNAGIAKIGLQGGAVLLGLTGTSDTNAFGAKVSGKIDIVNASLAYSHVNKSTAGVFNVGGVKTPLYTQMLLNQDKIRNDNDTVVGNINADVLGGNLGLSVDYTNGAVNDYTEADLIYKTKVGPVNMFAAYIYQDDDVTTHDAQNTVRVWGRYNF